MEVMSSPRETSPTNSDVVERQPDRSSPRSSSEGKSRKRIAASSGGRNHRGPHLAQKAKPHQSENGGDNELAIR